MRKTYKIQSMFMKNANGNRNQTKEEDVKH